MTTTHAALTALRRTTNQHPEIVPLGLAAIGWTYLTTNSTSPDSMVGMAGMPTDVAATVSLAVAMVAATMLPLTTTHVRSVAFDSAWPRRHRAVGEFLAAFTLIWVLLVVGASVALSRLERISSRPIAGTRLGVIAVAVVAALWQCTPWKRRALRFSHRRDRLAFAGWAASFSVARSGVLHAGRCVRSCWALMAMMLVADHSLFVMVALTAVGVAERRQRQPQLTRSAYGIAGLAALAFV
jgi:Predicted metal-binding integral membrane protein (DUF2182).